jgi:DNA-directed RNA polymerase specialized sigma24 family protein
LERDDEELDKAQRINCLREMEVFCYRLCYTLLRSEEMAHEAAMETLLRIWRDDRFFNSGADQAKLLKRQASEVCLASFPHRKKTHTIA